MNQNSITVEISSRKYLRIHKSLWGSLANLANENQNIWLFDRTEKLGFQLLVPAEFARLPRQVDFEHLGSCRDSDSTTFHLFVLFSFSYFYFFISFPFFLFLHIPHLITFDILCNFSVGTISCLRNRLQPCIYFIFAFFRRLLFLSICSTICNIKLWVPRNIILNKQTDWYINYSRLQKIQYENSVLFKHGFCLIFFGVTLYSVGGCIIFSYFFLFTVSIEVYFFPKQKTKKIKTVLTYKRRPQYRNLS